MRLAISILILIALLIQYIQVGFEAYAEPLYSIEVYGAVVRVIDGDTLDLRVLAVYKDKYISFNGSTIRVRLADINAPELSTPEGEEAKKALSSLVSGKNIYLDIDDLYIYDRYGRVVAIAYLPINSTHLLNINLWLVLNGYAKIVDYPNEFSPSGWSLYIVLNQTATAITITPQEITTIAMPITIYTTVEKISTETITIKPQNITLYRTLHNTLIKTADQISEKTVIITRIDTFTKTISNLDIGSLAAAILISLAIGFVIGYIALGSMRRG
ncbi:MAG: thermonuclease family protein [Sulfolobales archaeon]